MFLSTMIRFPACTQQCPRSLFAFPVLPGGCKRDITESFPRQSVQILLVATALVSVLLDAMQVSFLGDSLFLEVASCCVIGLLAESLFGIHGLRPSAMPSSVVQGRQEKPQSRNEQSVCKSEIHGFAQQQSRAVQESFSTRILKHVQEGKLKSAISVFETARTRGVKVDPAMHNAMVQAFAKLGKSQQAVALLEEMHAHGLYRPDHDTYLLTLSSLCKSKGGKCWMTAFDLLNQMQADNIKPEADAYAYVIKSCARDKQWERALALLNDMTKAGIEPNVFTYNAVLHVLSKSNLWERALAMMDEIKAKGLQPDTFTYNQVMTALTGSQDTRAWEHALSLFEELCHSGMAQPHRINSDKTMMIHMYNSVIAGCASAGNWQRALTLMQQMRSDGFSVQKAAYQSTINACSAAGEWERAKALLDEMRASCNTYEANGSESSQSSKGCNAWTRDMYRLRDLSD